jgi:DNA-binding LacI/PurR family transcriptional regulator
MATLKDIAQNLSLSVMAVSKALRDAPDISTATKARVRAEANRLGYVPNQTARSLRGGSSKLIGLLLPLLNDPFCANIASGLEQEAEARDYQVILGASRNNTDTEWKMMHRLVERQIEVLFVFPLVRLQQRSPILDAAAQRRLPVVFLDHYPAAATQYTNVGWVVNDSRRGGELATEHLLELGHRDILYLSGPPSVSSAAAHYTGYQKALTKAGIPPREELVFQAGYDIESGRQAMAKALAEEVDFTAIVSVSDNAAIGASELLRKQGYRLPEDVSVVGYGDGYLPANYAVPLTSVRQAQVDLGRSAFLLWEASVRTQVPLEGKVLPVEMIVRESTDLCRIPRRPPVTIS